jgi:hypothetical protein
LETRISDRMDTDVLGGTAFTATHPPRTQLHHTKQLSYRKSRITK